MQPKPHILIVEDDAALSEPLAEKLQNDFEITIADDGAKALEAALRIQPAAILLDLTMPQIDGFTVLHELRKDEHGKDIPVVILTNQNDNRNILESMKENAAAYLIKADTSLDTIHKTIHEILGK